MFTFIFEKLLPPFELATPRVPMGNLVYMYRTGFCDRPSPKSAIFFNEAISRLLGTRKNGMKT